MKKEVINIIITLDETNNLGYKTDVNFPSALVAGLALLRLEKIVTDLKTALLDASTQATEKAKRDKNFA